MTSFCTKYLTKSGQANTAMLLGTYIFKEPYRQVGEMPFVLLQILQQHE